MKILILFLLTFPQLSFAHGDHHDEMSASKPVSGKSIFQLDSKWKNQKGDVVSISDLQKNPRLLVMLYTKCETACPLIVEDLKDIAKELGNDKKRNFEVSIFSLDSFRETPESLAAFSVKRSLPSTWELYTSNADAVAELAAALGVRYKRLKNGDFIHSNVIYYLNGKGEIIAQKEGIKTPRGEFIKTIQKNM